MAAAATPAARLILALAAVHSARARLRLLEQAAEADLSAYI
ncbi:hypothetical protein [Streptomyces sp. NPDC006285]